MVGKDEVLFRQVGQGRYSIEAYFNQEFIDYIKSRIPKWLRDYDEETNIWTFHDDNGKRLNALTSIAAQKFRFAILQYRNNEGLLVIKNLKTGVEVIQDSLFKET